MSIWDTRFFGSKKRLPAFDEYLKSVRFGKRGMAQDNWITVHPNGEEHKGRHIELDENGVIVRGAGGRFNGMTLEGFGRPDTPRSRQHMKNVDTELWNAYLDAAHAHKDESDKTEMFKELHADRVRRMKEYVRKYEPSNPPKALKEPMSEEDAIERIAGGDMTDKGSCASAAIAFAANQELGLDVRDFRGGASRVVISAGFQLPMEEVRDGGYNPEKEGGNLFRARGNGIRETIKALDSMHPNKNYICCVGRHQAVVRKLDSGEIQYLELQSGNKSENGWQTLAGSKESYGGKASERNAAASATLKKRFGMNSGGHYAKSLNGVVPADRYVKTDFIQDNLQYVNTTGPKQQKGGGGSKK